MLRRMPWVLLVLVGGLCARAGAENCTGPNAVRPTPPVWDLPLVKPVEGGPNVGEPEVIYWVVCHTAASWTPLTPPPLGVYEFTERRIANAQGVPIQGQDSNPNNFRSTSGGAVRIGCSDVSPPSGQSGCNEHKWWGNGMNGTVSLAGGATYPYAYNWEASLANRSADPGVYQLQISHSIMGSNNKLTYVRNYNMGDVRPVEYRIKDQYGAPVPNIYISQTAPYNALDGPSNGFGILKVNRAASTYTVHAVSSEPFVAGSQDITYTIAQGGTGVHVVNVTLERQGGPEDPTKGHLQVRVLDVDTNSPIENATVSTGGMTVQTNAEGLVLFRRLETTEQQIVTVTKSGYQGGQAFAKIRSGSTTKIRVLLSTQSGEAPVVEEENSDEDAGFWEKLFVPKKATLDRFETFREQVSSWGPFGVVTSFVEAFSGVAWSGAPARVVELQMPYAGIGSGGLGGVLDLRPLVPEGQEYTTPPGRGSIFGTWYGYLRAFLGALIHVLMVLVLLKKLWPRLQV